MDQFDDRFPDRLSRLVGSLPHHEAPDLTGRRISPPFLRFLAVCAAAAGVLAIAVVAFGLRQENQPSVTLGEGAFSVSGMSFTYPPEWYAYFVSAGGGSFVYRAVLSTDEITGCDSDREAINIGCASSQPPSPGGMRLAMGKGGIFGLDLADHEPPGGWDLYVDGQPALVEVDESGDDGSDLIITWTIVDPHASDNFYQLTATIRGPGLEARRSQLENLIASIDLD
ncbi:MAG: hypothetical protein ACRDHD_05505 [Candidatus Limnocylindria bacterium]